MSDLGHSCWTGMTSDGERSFTDGTEQQHMRVLFYGEFVAVSGHEESVQGEGGGGHRWKYDLSVEGEGGQLSSADRYWERGVGGGG